MNDTNLVHFDAQKPDLPVVGKYTREADIIVIDDQFTYDAADDYLGKLKGYAKTIEAERKKAVDPLNKLKDVIQGWFKPVLDDCAAAEDNLKTKMLAFRNEQARIAREAQAEADKQARELKEHMEKEAAAAAKAGDLEKAEVIAATAAVVSAPVVAPNFVAPKGSHTVKKWKARINCAPADAVVHVAGFVAANPQYASLLTIDMGAATKLAALMERKFCVPGLEAYEDETLSKRS